MKVTFFSSVLNHHQIEFCDEMYTKLGNGFKFVSTMEMEEQRKNLLTFEGVCERFIISPEIHHICMSKLNILRHKVLYIIILTCHT